MCLNKNIITTILIIITTLYFTPISFSQLNFAQLQQLNINFKQANFKNFKVSNLYLQVQKLDFKAGYIAKLTAKCTNFVGKNFYLDNLTLKMNNIHFDTDALLKEQEVILKQPVNAEASVLMSETNLNSLLNSPKVIKKLSNIGKIKIKQFGIQLNSGLISFYEPKVHVLTKNTLKIEMKANMANQVNIPITFYTTPVIIQGKVKLTAPRIETSGVPLPQELTQILNSILNTIIDLDRILKGDVIVHIESLKFSPNKSISFKGKALIKKLKLTKKKKEAT